MFSCSKSLNNEEVEMLENMCYGRTLSQEERQEDKNAIEQFASDLKDYVDVDVNSMHKQIVSNISAVMQKVFLDDLVRTKSIEKTRASLETKFPHLKDVLLNSQICLNEYIQEKKDPRPHQDEVFKAIRTFMKAALALSEKMADASENMPTTRGSKFRQFAAAEYKAYEKTLNAMMATVTKYRSK